MMQGEINKSVDGISRELCSGCMMCGDICPKSAISFPLDKGFWYPDVNEKTCINCGLCSKRCPVINVNHGRESESVDYYGVKSKDEDVRWHSTSGGFFSELAHFFLQHKGLVIGAIYDENNTIIHAIGDKEEDIKRLRQSKYAQSITQGIYKQVKFLLKQNKRVLFCGTPCQVEALYSYLGNGEKNLVTMDFFCLGICSPWIYRKYLELMETKFQSKVYRVWFKNKANGWRSISNQIDFENGLTYLRSGGDDLFMRLFVYDKLSMRANCSNCKFRSMHHISDFTVGDFWGIEHIRPDMDDNKGVSALCVNTKRARHIFEKIKDRMCYFPSDAESISQRNFSTLTPFRPNPKRLDFLDAVSKEGLLAAAYKYSSYTRFFELKRNLRLIKGKIKRLIRG